MNQGWLLVLLTSLTTGLGCLFVFADVFYKVLFPKAFRSKPFDVQKNTAFLVSSLSLSSGSIIFSSFYKLLPEALSYFVQMKAFEGKGHLLKATLAICFFLGIVCCSTLNLIIHFFTSESIVHCVHENPSGEDHSEHSSERESTDSINSYKPQPPATSTSPLEAPATETSPLLDNTPGASGVRPKRLSLVDLSLKALKGTKIEGQCLGPIDSCQNNIVACHDLHPAQKGDLHFCTLPKEENILFINPKLGLIRQKSEICLAYPELEVSSPLLIDDHDHAVHDIPSTLSHSANASSIDNHHHDPSDIEHHGHKSVSSRSSHDHHNHIHNHEDLKGEQHHHHHIQTPLSRLLSIGLQTILALTLHKLPEGFIMYSTSQADPTLGLTIFLSMFIHNFVEGFTMTLPMSIALNSRFKAILVSGSLGCLAQPFGALLGWLLFRGSLDLTLDSNLMLFGSLIALTAGFLVYIGFQMFASAIGFGGKQETVMKWTFFGIFLMLLSDILIGLKED